MNGPACWVWHFVQVSVAFASAAPWPRTASPLCTSWQSTQVTLPAITGWVWGRLNWPRFSRWHWKQVSGDLRGLTIEPAPPPASTWTLPGPWQASQPVSPSFGSANAILAWVDPAKCSTVSPWHWAQAFEPTYLAPAIWGRRDDRAVDGDTGH